MLTFTHYHADVLNSTNDKLIDMAKQGVSEGRVVTCDFQTRGRGRKKRQWESKRGENLLLSLLVRPSLPPHKIPGLTRLAQEAVQATLLEFGISSRGKRPNDVLVREKKIAGILTESQTLGSQVKWCVVGLGLNVNSSLETLPPEAISMKEAGGALYEIHRVKDIFLRQFNQRYEVYGNFSSN